MFGIQIRIDPITAQPRNIKKIAVLGAGRCGRQILHCFSEAGYEVVAYEANEDFLAISRDSYDQEAFPILSTGERDGVRKTQPIWTSSLQTVATVDLVIESIVEDLSLKRDLIQKLTTVCANETILATNSSYFLPSSVFRGVQNPERIASLHFHLPPWFATAVDIMPTMRTSQSTLETLERLVLSIGLTPIRLLREYPGYIFNSLLHPLLVKSLELAQREVASPEIVDLAWRAVTGMPTGPFGMMQQIGTSTLSTILDRALTIYQDEGTRRARAFLDTWDGTLAATKQPQPSPISKAPLRLNNQKQGSLFKPYRQEWQEFETQVFDTTSLHVGVENRISHFEVLGDSRFSLSLHQTLNGLDSLEVQRSGNLAKSIVWVIEPSKDQSLLSARDLTERIAMLRGLVAHQSSLCKPVSFVIVLPVDSCGRVQTCAWGMVGMLRSAWLEQFGTNGAVLHPLGLKILSVDMSDLESVTKLASDIRTNAFLTEKVLYGETEHDRLSNFIKDYAGLHLYRDRHVWCIPKLVPVKYSSGSTDWDTSIKSELNGTTWIVSDGAYGFNAQLARVLAKCGARLILLGGTPLPSEPLHNWSEEYLAERKKTHCREAHLAGLSSINAANNCDRQLDLACNLDWLREQNVVHEYRQINVSSRLEVEQLSNHLQDRGIAIDGILHGAGVEQSTRLRQNSDEVNHNTLACKIDASKHLANLISRRSRWFIQCGSVTGFFGGAGRMNSSAANDFQACFAESLSDRWPNVQALTIGWPVWAEAGVTNRPSNVWSTGRQGQKLMSIGEGTSLFLELLIAKVSGSVLLLPPDEIPEPLR